MSSPHRHVAESRHRVVVIGSGFGGLFAVKRLQRAHVDVTLVSKMTYHLFQPLLYQVATGILSEGEIAPTTRELLKRQRNVRVLYGEVKEIDLAEHSVTSTALGQRTVLSYDSLIVAAGAHTSYFGNDAWSDFAPGLKSIEDALEVRARIFGSLEAAELEPHPEKRRAWLTFVVVGAGSTGVEMTGQLLETTRKTVPKEFREIDTRGVRVLLVDAADGVLRSFGEGLSQRTERRLTKLGAELRLNTKVKEVKDGAIVLTNPDSTEETVDTHMIFWAAGVTASPLGSMLAEQSGLELSKGGRVPVKPDLTLPGHPEVFVIGDMMDLNGYPGVSQVAMQGGRYAAETIAGRLTGKPPSKPFHYFDKGSMATVSKFNAVADIGPFRFDGFIAWLLWLFVHIFYLIGFRNRVSTLMHWGVTFIAGGRSERTATFREAEPTEKLTRS